MENMDSTPLRFLVADDDPSRADRWRRRLTDADAGALMGGLSPEVTVCAPGEAVDRIGRARDRGRAPAVGVIGLPDTGDPLAVPAAIRRRAPYIELILVTAGNRIGFIEAARRLPPAHRLRVLAGADESAGLIQMAVTSAEKWRAEAARRGLQAMLSAFCTHYPGFAFIKDLDGRYRYLNPAGRAGLGVASGGWRYRTAAELWPANIAGRQEAEDERLRGGGGPSGAVEWLPLPDGPVRHRVIRFSIPDGGRPYLLAGLTIPPADEAPAPADTVSDGEPDDLPGLRVAEGLRRVGGSWPMYLDLVRFFVNDKARFGRRFREMIADADFHHAQIAAHSLKGSAATIGAVNLRAAAYALENACTGEDPERIEPSLAAVERALAELQDASESLPAMAPKDDGKARPTGTELDTGDILKHLHALDRSLDDYDPLRSETLMTDILAGWNEDRLPEAATLMLREIQTRMDGYRFDEARETLAHLISRLNTGGDDAGPHVE